MVADSEYASVADQRAKIFISYSRKDFAFADRLEAALKARGFEPLIDRTEIYAFENWWARIQALIGEADTIVFVLSPDAVASDVCKKEVAFAASLNKRFAPIVWRRVEANAVPEALRRLNFIFFDDDRGFDLNADRLAEALRTDIAWIRQHTGFGAQARRWAAAGRPGPRGLLLRSPVLEEAERWIASHPRNAPAPTEEARAFVTESRRSATRQRRRLQALSGGVVFGVAVGLAAWLEHDRLTDYWRWVSITRPYIQAQVRPYVLTPAAERALNPMDSFKECAKDCPEMIVVPAGSFMMGTPATAKTHGSEEEPQHRVKIAQPFAISKFELTFADWDACASVGGCDPHINDSGFGRGLQPVINVTWGDAQRYAAWLSTMTGKSYRLLSEAEFEYATRAGTHTRYPWGDEVGTLNANCYGCSSAYGGQQPAPVGGIVDDVFVSSFPPNQFGLYDTVGNVWEWVEDCIHKNYDGAPDDGSAWTDGGNCTDRMVRGGSWSVPSVYVTSASRTWHPTDARLYDLGFRIGRTLSAGAGAITAAPGAR